MLLVRPEAHPTVVELVGLAGAGKTTLARELVRTACGLQLDLPLSRARSAFHQGLATAPHAIPYLRHAAGSPWFTRDEARALGYLRAWQHELGRWSDGPPFLVLDHGPLFRLALLDAFGPPLTRTAVFRRWWDDTLSHWVRTIDLVVWLDAPEELLVARIRERDQGHVLRTAGDEESSIFLARYRDSYDRILDRVRTESPHRVVELRSDCESARELAHRVREQLGAEERRDG